MSQTEATPAVLDACNQHRAIENLRYCNDTIESVKKKLNAYLHEKQLAGHHVSVVHGRMQLSEIDLFSLGHAIDLPKF